MEKGNYVLVDEDTGVTNVDIMRANIIRNLFRLSDDNVHLMWLVIDTLYRVQCYSKKTGATS